MTNPSASEAWFPTHEIVWQPSDCSTPLRWIVQVLKESPQSPNLVAITERDWRLGREPDWRCEWPSTRWLWRGLSEVDSRGGCFEIRSLEVHEIELIRERSRR